MSFSIRTEAFPNGGEIPKQYTCSGSDVSPALRWSEVPQNTKSLALIADDPDAPGGTWTHWVIWDIPAQSSGLPEGVPTHDVLETGARQGKNDFGRIGYGGPCPPHGKSHRYFFRLYALDHVLQLKAGSERPDLEDAMKRHVVSQAEWMGTFKR
jgi:Raf kinase inhibitor-like YbhB/YbcL family protein